ncbi:MAG: cyclic 2,3-diphosphoglycerate synthase [Polyangiales bacterium]
MTKPFRCIVLGAAGRDFHDFRTFFRDHPEFRVVAFTATQIPFIETRVFPRSLAGPDYDADIPIHPEERLAELVRAHDVDFVCFAYSDVAHEEVMHKASIAHAAGASFLLLGPKHTQLRSSLPVVAVVATRTGAGKSPLTQAIARHLVGRGLRVGVIRHPMPYGDLERQAVQRFATAEDLARAECTVEEREEYEPYVEMGTCVYAGVDYVGVLALAESESDVILWDGGNNDFSFLAADLVVTVVDPLRAGHELRFHPGETNLRMADVVVISKASRASEAELAEVERNAARLAPSAEVVRADLEVTLDEPDAVRGRRVLVVEDGPTVTHGGMPTGAGYVAAERYGARTVVDPRPFAVGSIAEAYARHPHLGPILPALGYAESQLVELAATIERAEVDVVIDASPAALVSTLGTTKKVVRARYRFAQRTGPDLFALVDRRLSERVPGESP